VEAIGTVRKFLNNEHGTIEVVTFVLFDQRTFDSYEQALGE